MMGYGYGYGGHMSGWGWAVTGVGSVLLWVALVLGVLSLARHLRDTTGPRGGDGLADPERLLAARYARGDIDDEDYHRRLDTLRSLSSPLTPPRR